jgi:hypothetical protein
MKANLENFPKAVNKYYPDHKHGVNSNERELAEVGKAAITWRSDFEKELKGMYSSIEFSEGYDESYRVAIKALIREIFGQQYSKTL